MNPNCDHFFFRNIAKKKKKRNKIRERRKRRSWGEREGKRDSDDIVLSEEEMKREGEREIGGLTICANEREHPERP